MKIKIEVEFKNGEEASNAAKIISNEKNEKISLKRQIRGRKLIIEIKAASFSSLRARTTSILRDLKVIRDAFSIK